MKKLAKIREDLEYIPWLVRLLLVIFLDGIYGGIYRFTKGDTRGIIIGVLWISLSYLPFFVFGPIGTIPFGIFTIVDIVSVAFFGNIKVFA